MVSLKCEPCASTKSNELLVFGATAAALISTTSSMLHTAKLILLPLTKAKKENFAIYFNIAGGPTCAEEIFAISLNQRYKGWCWEEAPSLGDGQLCLMGSLMSHCFLNSEKPSTIVLMESLKPFPRIREGPILT